MKIFISWSGSRSKAIASALRGWLPKVVQGTDPWMSDEDLAKGTRWSNGISRQLQESKYGLFCLTKENLEHQWLNFEAGALAKLAEESRIYTLLFQMKHADVTGPLAMFQHTLLEQEEMRKLVVAINSLTLKPMTTADVIEVFDVWWPKLQAAIDVVPPSPIAHKTRPVEEITDEILGIVRSQSRPNAGTRARRRQSAYSGTSEPPAA